MPVQCSWANQNNGFMEGGGGRGRTKGEGRAVVGNKAREREREQNEISILVLKKKLYVLIIILVFMNSKKNMHLNYVEYILLKYTKFTEISLPIYLPTC